MEPTRDLVALLIDAQEGNQAAFAQLLEHYRPRLLAGVHLAPPLRRRADASDIVQSASLAIFKDFSAFRGTTIPEFESWLSTVLRRSVLMTVRHETAQRRDSRKEEIPAFSADSASAPLFPADHTSPSAKVSWNEEWRRIQEPLLQLPERQQQAIRLRFEADRSLEEIAAELQCSTAAAAGLLRRALEKLRSLAASPSEAGHERHDGTVE